MKKHKHFSESLWNKITHDLTLKLEQSPGPHSAAFDADGTLWDCDVGEGFFQYMIDNKLVPLPADPWAHYRDLKAIDPRIGFLWLAQICAPHKLSTVQSWAKTYLEKTQPVAFFESQKKLIDWLQVRGVKVFVVTASIKWAVEPFAEIFHIPFENVLGVKTQVINGLVTDIQDGPITYQPGKVEALLEATKGIPPIFCSGNSTGDIQLLKCSTGLALAVSSTEPEYDLYEVEQKLKLEAIAQNWLTHDF